MTDRDHATLVGVHPLLIDRITHVLAALEALGFPMLVTDGLRTNAQQAALYAKGRTAPGPIVTYADGIVKRSNHQAHADGLGHACDACFVVEGHPSWDLRLPWNAYGACGESLGLTWGGSGVGAWAKLHDLPHLELP